MTFLEKFHLPFAERRVYPYRILCSKVLDSITFAPITIFYGNNGSGKSTLLNVIAEKIGIRHKALGNSSFFFNEFVEKCAFQLAERNGREAKIPSKSRLIRSKNIAEGIVNLRKKTGEAEKKVLAAQDEKESYFAWKAHHETPEQLSNGETAIAFFESIFEPDTLYLLDEPENSLSPSLQLMLKEMIEKHTYLPNYQIITAAHSPFVLAIDNATIYNLDRQPSDICRWQDLENVRIYWQFF
ncbi:MAG: AAA family ATPase [Bacteroidales bacterium]|jgi:predicted ATPase|nr:AAA family ATPase [Bacteroidales bacterium]